MTLKELTEKIKHKKAESMIDISEMRPGLQSTADGKKRQAKIELALLEKEYRNLIQKYSISIAVSGEGTEEFALIAAKLGWFIVDFDHVVHRITNSIKKRSGRDVFESQEWWLFMDELNQLKTDFDIIHIPSPAPINYTGTDVYTAVKQIIDKSYGDSLRSAVSHRVIGEGALDSLFDGDRFPVVLANCNNVDEVFLIPPVKKIEVEEGVTEAECIRIFKSVVKSQTIQKMEKKETKKD